VMDEPDAHLDEAGDRALAEAIVALRAQRCSVVVITHRKELLALMDSVLVIHDGQLAAFGPRDQVLKAIEGARKPLLQEASQASMPKSSPMSPSLLAWREIVQGLIRPIHCNQSGKACVKSLSGFWQ